MPYVQGVISGFATVILAELLPTLRYMLLTNAKATGISHDSIALSPQHFFSRDDVSS
jgi:hypothetical protein